MKHLVLLTVLLLLSVSPAAASSPVASAPTTAAPVEDAAGPNDPAGPPDQGRSDTEPAARPRPPTADRAEPGPAPARNDERPARREAPAAVAAPVLSTSAQSRPPASSGRTPRGEPTPPPSIQHGPRRGRGGWRPPPAPPRGRRGQWRRDRYVRFGSWRFLFFCGPVIYHPPRTTHVVRLPRRTGVYVRQTGDDEIGRAFASSVRERLRTSGLKVAHTDADAGLELYIVSMEEDPEDPGWGSAISVSYISHPGHRFITAQLVDAGYEQLDDLADMVVSYTGDLTANYWR
ncbi:MAG: hypothetical protein R6X14_09890 [bacterium]